MDSGRGRGKRGGRGRGRLAAERRAEDSALEEGWNRGFSDAELRAVAPASNGRLAAGGSALDTLDDGDGTTLSPPPGLGPPGFGAPKVFPLPRQASPLPAPPGLGPVGLPAALGLGGLPPPNGLPPPAFTFRGAARGSHGFAQQRARGRGLVMGRGGGVGRPGRESVTWPMGLGRLRDLWRAKADGSLSEVDLLHHLYADGTFAKRLQTVGEGSESVETRLLCLRLLAAAVDYEAAELRQTIQSLLGSALSWGLLEADELLKAIRAAKRSQSPESLAEVSVWAASLLVLAREAMRRLRTRAAAELRESTRQALRRLPDEALLQPLFEEELAQLHARFVVAADELEEWEERGREPKAPEKPQEALEKSMAALSIEQCLSEPPPEDFRSLSIIPTKRDILASGPGYMRPIRESGPYASTEEYLDIHFRLLREDCLHDLREGVREYLNLASAETKDGRPAKRSGNMRVYRGARIGVAAVDKKGDMASAVTFDAKPFGNLQWEASKRLIYGSLLIFTSDEFKKELVFAVVQQSDPTRLREGRLEVVFEDSARLRPDRDYVFAETSAYFGAYRYVLEGLKRCTHFNLPFRAQLVEAQTETPPPRYLKGAAVDFAPLVSEAAKEAAGAEAHWRRPADSPDQWPDAASLGHAGLDPSQIQEAVGLVEAVEHVLTRSLAMVQGPPGTGKTFLGLLLLKLLLWPPNRQLWWPSKAAVYETGGGRGRNRQGAMQERGRPILVVCYTNHALDQFLEGVLELPEDHRGKVIRVGGRCKVQALANHSLFHARAGVQLSGDLRFRIREAKESQMERQEVLLRCLVGLKLLPLEVPSTLSVREHVPLGSEAVLSGALTAVERLGVQMGWAAESGTAFLAWLLGADLLRDELQDIDRVDQVTRQLGAGREAEAIWLLRQHADSVEETLEYLVSRETEMEPPRDLPRVRLSRPKLERLYDNEIGTLHASLALLHSDFDVEAARAWLKPPEQPPRPQEEAKEKPPPAAVDEEAGVFQELVESREVETGGDASRDFAQAMAEVEAEWRQRLLSSAAAYERVELSVQGPAAFREPKKVLERQWSTLKRAVVAAAPLSPEELASLRPADIRHMAPVTRRWSFLAGVRRALTEACREALPVAEKAYAEAAQQLKEAHLLADTEVMQTGCVVGMTTSGAARYGVALQSVRPAIVVVEEAAEVFEAHLIAALSQGTQHLIMIGDHQQLRPSPAVFGLAKDYRLDLSLFERLINNNMPHRQLTEQHRMRPGIARPLMPTFYPKLTDHPNTHARPHVQGMSTDLYFLQHSHREAPRTDFHDKSFKNPEEARLAVALAVYLRQQGYESHQLTVLACYAGQFLLLRDLLKAHVLTQDVSVKVVDNYQGEEADLIILSMVRSNAEGKIGFLKTKNRVTVALSRARLGFYALGNFSFLAQHSETWRELVSSLRSVAGPAAGETEEEGQVTERIGPAFPVRCPNHGIRDSFATPDDFQSRAPEGGCALPCETAMGCGHVCVLICHGYDLDHSLMPCSKPCARSCAREKHDCRGTCAEECPPCRVFLDHRLACGHFVQARCSEETSTLDCQWPCEETLDCGHECQGKCGAACPPCQTVVERRLECGHTQETACFERHTPLTSLRCRRPVDKLWPACGHTSPAECGTEVWSTPCPMPCGSKLDCGHVCRGSCGLCHNQRLHPPCPEKCGKRLACGHECVERCSEGAPCGPCAQPCASACPHTSCHRAISTITGRRGRRCDEPCLPCAEPCQWKCPHLSCTKPVEDSSGRRSQRPRLCSEPCGRPRCDEACGKWLKCPETPGCEFLCRGVCGEPCLLLCPDCHPRQWAAVPAHGDDTATFVQLKDCGHVLPTRLLDQSIDAGQAQPRLKHPSCPQCETPIRQSLRYGPALKAHQRALEAIKAQRTRPTEAMERAWAPLLGKLKELAGEKRPDVPALPQAARAILDQAQAAQESPGLSVGLVERLRNALCALLSLRGLVRSSAFDQLKVALGNKAASAPLLWRLVGGRGPGTQRETWELLVRRWLVDDVSALARRLADHWPAHSPAQARRFAAEVERSWLGLSLGLVLTEEAREESGTCADLQISLAGLLEAFGGPDLVEPLLSKAFAEELSTLGGRLGVTRLPAAERPKVAFSEESGEWHGCRQGHVYLAAKAACPHCLRAPK